MSRATAVRNVHFLDAGNNEVAGFWQNGSVVWEEVQEWMHIVFTNPQSDYVPYRCLEDGDPQDPGTSHGPQINMTNNKSPVDTGYYVLLSDDGKF